MRIRLFSVYALSISSIILFSCSTGNQIKKNGYTGKITVDNPVFEEERDIERDVKGREYNFKFVGYDINIDDPAWDRRSYYKIFIDKVDAGRTTIGLESQKKIFESRISSNRHLLVVEKWALDEKKGQYVKLNNIEQPKPGYIYFDLPPDKTATIILRNDPFISKSEFEVEID